MLLQNSLASLSDLHVLHVKCLQWINYKLNVSFYEITQIKPKGISVKKNRSIGIFPKKITHKPEFEKNSHL